MNKLQNAIPKVRAALDLCRDNGVLVISGLMLSPLVDDLDYLRRLPRYLRDSGLHVPTFICFESPIPGTPHFQRLARMRPSPFLPHALLRDFTGYTLVVKPAHASAEEFVDVYRQTLRAVYAPANRIRKLVDDVPRFLGRGAWLPALIDAVDAIALDPCPSEDRSLLAGSDTPPPERVPFAESDFSSEAERRSILEPWRVTDEGGRVLDTWLSTTKVFDRPRSAQAQSARAAGGTA
jgi:hypothetical protein